MKFFLMFILMIGGAYAEIGPVNKSISADNTGAVYPGTLDQYYIRVKNTSGGALLNGDAVIIDVSQDDGFSVTTTTSGSTATPHCILDQACASSQICRCQTYGLKEIANFDSTTASAVAGNEVFLSPDYAGKVRAELIPGTGGTPLGIFYDAASASGEVEVFIYLR